MEPQQLHSNPTHTHDFSFYDHHRHEDISRDQRTRESDLLNTIISFPSTSTQPVLLHRNSLQDRRMSPSNSSFFLHSTSSTTASLDVGASRDELLQLSGRLDLCESNLAGREKLQDLRTLPGAIGLRFQEESILARLNPSTLGGADGVTWQTYSDVNDIAGSTSVSNDTLQLPINMNLGVHNMLSNILPVNSDQRGGASYGHRRDAMWADDHGTELLLLPGISAANDEHTHQHQQIIPHKQPGNASDQDRQQSSSFSGLSTYASTSGGSLRDLSLSLSARENSLFGVRGFLTAAGSTSCSQTQSSIYLKAAQYVLREECSKAIAGAGARSLVAKGNSMCTNAAGVAASAIVSNELSFEMSRNGAGTVNMVGNSFNVHAQETDMQVRSSQQYDHHHHQQHQVPAAMAHLQLQDQYGRVQAYGHNGGSQLVQPAIMMDRSQQLELKRRKLYIMLEEVHS